MRVELQHLIQTLEERRRWYEENEPATAPELRSIRLRVEIAPTEDGFEAELVSRGGCELETWLEPLLGLAREKWKESCDEFEREDDDDAS